MAFWKACGLTDFFGGLSIEYFCVMKLYAAVISLKSLLIYDLLWED